MKILVVSTQISGHGGIPRFTRNVIEQLESREDTTVKIVSLNDSEQQYHGARRNKILFVFKFIYLLVKMRPDQIICNHLHLVRLSFFKFLSPSTFWQVVIHGREAWPLRKELKWYYPKIDRFWAVSSYTKRTFAQSNGVAEERIKIVLLTTPDLWETNINNLSYSPFFISVSRLEKEIYKGVDKTIEAIHQHEAEMRAFGYKYIIVGDGDDLQRHIDLVNNYKLSDIISFKSQISDVELKELYRTTSCSILPSQREGFGLVFLEAMAFKKAVIGCKNCGSEDVIEHGITGYLISPEEDEIWKHMQLLMKQPELFKLMGEAGYLKREKEFKGEKTRENMEKLLDISGN